MVQLHMYINYFFGKVAFLEMRKTFYEGIEGNAIE